MTRAHKATFLMAIIATGLLAAGVSRHAAAQNTVSNSTVTVQLQTSNGPVNVSNNGIVSTTGFSAVHINSTSANNVVTIGHNGFVASNSGTILLDDASITGPVVINVSGSLLGIGSIAKAVEAAAATANIQFASSGLVSGSIDTGSGTDSIRILDGVMRGNINTGAGADTFQLVSGTFTGNLDMDNGNDTATISGGILNGNTNLGVGNNTFTQTGGQVNGNLSAGTGNDTFTFSGGTYTGNITAGEGLNAINISNGLIIGNINTVSGTDHVTITGQGYISGTLSDNQVTDNDILTFANSRPYTLVNLVEGFETVNVGSELNVRQSLTGAQFFNITNGGIVNADASLALASGGQLNISGTLNIAAGKQVTAGPVRFGPDSILGIRVSDSTSAGQLVTTNVVTPSKLQVLLNPASGYIPTGTSYQVVDASGLGVSTLPSLVANGNGLYTYGVSLTDGDRDITLTLTRKQTQEFAESGTQKNIANELDRLGTATPRGDLVTVQSALTNASSGSGVNSIVASLTPGNETGAAFSSLNTGSYAANTISSRLAGLRTGEEGGVSGIATGDGLATSNVWGQAFGTSAKQDAKDGNAGFDATTGGLTAGVDTDTIIDGLTTGLAVTYARSSIDATGGANATTDADSYLVTLYGSRVLDSGTFINGQLGGGYNQYDASRQVTGFTAPTKASYNGSQYTAKAEVGHDLPLSDYGAVLTPLAGLQYTHLVTGGYTETGPAALQVDSKALNAVDLSAGAELGWTYGLTTGGSVRPNIRGRYIYRAGDTAVQSTSRFVAGGNSFATRGVDVDRGSVNLGTGLLITSAEGADISLDYDANIGSGYTAHTGQVKVRVPF